MFRFIADNPKTVIAALLLFASFGAASWRNLPVDVFPDISIPRVTVMTEAGGLAAEEVEQLVTIPIEAAVNGIPGVSAVRSSSSGGLSFVWVDFDWNSDASRVRFDVFERLSRLKDTLPQEASTEIAPVVSVTGEIMLIALTAKEGGASPMEIREMAEYDLRTRILAVPGIGEVAVIGGRLPEYRIAADPVRVAAAGLSFSDVVDAARDSRTFLSAGYLADVAGEEVPLRQTARADTLEDLRRSPVPLSSGGSLRLGDLAAVSVAGEPRRGSASFNGREAVVLSVQKVPGGSTPEITAAVESVLADFASTAKKQGIEVHLDAYRQADFISASIAGGSDVLRMAVIVVAVVLLVTLLELRTLLVVLCTMPFSVFLGISLFPVFGLGVNVMTIGGFAVAAGDIVDAAIIFAEVVRRKLGERSLLPPEKRPSPVDTISSAVSSVAPGVLFSTLVVILVFVPLLMLGGIEGRFFRPLALSYICIFSMSLVAAWIAVPALAGLFRLGAAPDGAAKAGVSPGVRIMRLVYAPFLSLAMRFPKTVLFGALAAFLVSLHVAAGFGSDFLPPFREDSFNVMISLPPGTSLAEAERIGEAAVPAMRTIPGVLSVTRRTGRAERDQHAEPVSSSEFVVRVDLKRDVDAVRAAIRERLGGIPSASVTVGYPIAHRISAVLSGTESEIAIDIFGEDADVLRNTAAAVKRELETMDGVADVRANREIAVKTLRIDYDMGALAEAGLTPREAGEQVSAAFNGIKAGEVRNGIRRRSVTVRLEGDDNGYDEGRVKSFVLSGRSGRRVRLDEVAEISHESAPNLLLREGGRRKALVSCNPAPGVDTGRLVDRMENRLSPIVSAAGCSISFGGSHEARESAADRLCVLGAALAAAVFLILLFALGSVRSALLALLNVPLGLIGSVAAVALSGKVLSVSSLVGFVTVTGFTLRNGMLLLNAYRDRLAAGGDLSASVREGSMERMAPIVLTSLTTVIGLVPIVLSGDTPGGELLAPLAVVQFGGLVGSTLLNLIVLPAAVIVFGTGFRNGSGGTFALAALAVAIGFSGCRSYEARQVDWKEEMSAGITNEVRLSSPHDAEVLSLAGNRQINAMRLKAANSSKLAGEYGWWEDPELGFDLLRIVDPSSHPFLGGASAAFTIPLSGALKSETASAQAYAAADRAKIVAAERIIAADARKSAIRLASLHEIKRMLESHFGDDRIVRSISNVERLHAAGEVTAGGLAGMRRSIHARRHAIMDVAREIAEEEIVLLRLSGLRPGARIVADFTPSVPSAGHVAPVDAASLVRHVEVEVALAELGATEAELEAQIRRQYPDLKLGPAYSNEEGLDRLGIVAGFTLPLWNRNRKGIAEAEGRRDEARLRAIDVWRALVCDAAAAYRSFVHLAEHPPVPPSERSESDRLADAGELGPLDYLAVRDEILEQKLSEARWRRDVALSAAELEKFR